MKKLVEISIRGSQYYILLEATMEQLRNLENYAMEFYSASPIYCCDSDDSIAQHFITAAQRKFGLRMDRVSIDYVLTIK